MDFWQARGVIFYARRFKMINIQAPMTNELIKSQVTIGILSNCLFADKQGISFDILIW